MTRLDTLVALANRARAYADARGIFVSGLAAPKVSTATNLTGTWFRIAKAYSGPRDGATPTNTDVYLYDEIGMFGVTACTSSTS